MDEIEKVFETKIVGLQLTKLNSFHDSRGAVYKFLDKTQKSYIEFGEVYFSLINKGVIKGWKLHRIAVQNICAVYGETVFVIHDGRIDSSSFNQFEEIRINPNENHILITIPPGVWYAFKSYTSSFSIISNVSSIVHDPKESDSLDFESIKYEWRY